MPLVANKLIKGVVTGGAVGVEGVGRYLSERQRGALVEQLTEDVAARGQTLIAQARAEAATIVAQAEAQVDAIRAQALAEGYAEGTRAGHAEALAQMTPHAALLRQATDAAADLRARLLDGLEEQAIAFALTAARRVVGAAADAHADLAVDVVRAGIRAAAGRVLRVCVHPDDAAAVSVALLSQGDAAVVHTDAAVQIGGCILDLEGGAVDLRLGVQLDTIEGAFSAARDRAAA